MRPNTYPNITVPAPHTITPATYINLAPIRVSCNEIKTSPQKLSYIVTYTLILCDVERVKNLYCWQSTLNTLLLCVDWNVLLVETTCEMNLLKNIDAVAISKLLSVCVSPSCFWQEQLILTLQNLCKVFQSTAEKSSWVYLSSCRCTCRAFWRAIMFESRSDR